MDQKKISQKIRILRAQLDLLKANADAIDTALTVLEKEVVGSGMPATSKSKAKKEEVVEKTNRFLAKHRARQIKKAKEGDLSTPAVRKKKKES